MKRVEHGNSEPTERPYGRLYSSGTKWRGLTLERGHADAGEMSEGYLLSHGIVLMPKCARQHVMYVPDLGWHTVEPDHNLLHFFPAQMPYAGRWNQPVDGILLLFTPDFVRSVEEPGAGLWRIPPTYWTARSPILTELILALDREAAEGSPWGALYGECLGAAFIAELSKQYNAGRTSAKDSGSLPLERLDVVIEYIHDNLAADLSLTTLAAVSGCSVRRFMHLFKRKTGCSPHQYVMRERISVSRALLMQRDAAVTEVAFRVGFQDQSHFSKLFRRLTGMSPGAYQRQSRR